MGLNIPVINSCFCLSLRTAAIITGALQLLVFTLYFVQMLILTLRYTVLVPIVKFDELIRDLLYVYTDVFNIIAAVILIIGIVKEQSSLVAAWLLFALTRIIDTVLSTVLTSFLYFHVGYFIEELIFIGLELICFWIGYSYYTTMPKNHKYIF